MWSIVVSFPPNLFVGKYREADETIVDPPADYVCENFAEAVKLILSQ